MGPIPDSELLPEPQGEMYEFYEGLDTNLFSESTGINHNSAPKWLKAELKRHLEFLSYLLSIKDQQAIMSDNIVHTRAIIDDNVTLPKLHPEIRNILTSLRLENIIERNSVQTIDSISVSVGKIRVKAGTIISQADGFGAQGQKDIIEVLEEVDLDQTVGESTTGYLYKVVGGAYEQFTFKQNSLNRQTMVGTKVYLGSFTTDGTGLVNSVTPAVPAFHSRVIEEPVFTGDYVQLPEGTTASRPTAPKNGQIRFNNDTKEYEGFKLGRWDSLGGGQMLGQATIKAISYNAQVIDEDLVVKSGTNAWSVGNITVADGCKITVENNAVYKIL